MSLLVVVLSQLVVATCALTTSSSPNQTYTVPSVDGYKPVAEIDLWLPSSQPCFAEPLSPHLASMGFEMAHFWNWTGPAVGQPNMYTHAVLNQIQSRVGVPMWLRIGGSTVDRGLLAPGVEVVNETFSAPPGTPGAIATYVGIGRDWYALGQNLPNGTMFTFGVNLKNLNETETVGQASLIADTFYGSKKDQLAQVKLELIEIGNEVEQYRTTAVPLGVPPLNFSDAWDARNYSQHFIQYSEAIQDVFGENDIGFSLGVLGGGFTWQGFSSLSLIEAGILDANVTKSNFCEHMYFASFPVGGPTPPPGTLMTKSNTRTQLLTKLAEKEYSNKAGLPFILGETNSAIHGGVQGLSNTAESAIWGADYMLYAASIGISRLHIHSDIGATYSVFAPEAGLDDGTGQTDRPHLNPLFYSFLVVNEAIGTSGNSWVAELGVQNNSISSTTSTLSAFGIYENQDLTRIVLINTVPFAPGNDTSLDRSAVYVNFANWYHDGSATVKYLETPATNVSTGLTWGGQDFNTPDVMPAGSYQEWVLNGTNVLVPASTVALICLK